MTDNNIDQRLTKLETKFDHVSSVLDEIKKKLDEISGEKHKIREIETRITVLENSMLDKVGKAQFEGVRFISLVAVWLGSVLGSGVVGYIILAIMKII